MMIMPRPRATLPKVETRLTLTSLRVAKVVQAPRMRVSQVKTLKRKTPKRKMQRRLISNPKLVTKTLIAKKSVPRWQMTGVSVNNRKRRCSSISRAM